MRFTLVDPCGIAPAIGPSAGAIWRRSPRLTQHFAATVHKGGGAQPHVNAAVSQKTHFAVSQKPALAVSQHAPVVTPHGPTVVPAHKAPVVAAKAPAAAAHKSSLVACAATPEKLALVKSVAPAAPTPSWMGQLAQALSTSNGRAALALAGLTAFGGGAGSFVGPRHGSPGGPSRNNPSHSTPGDPGDPGDHADPVNKLPIAVLPTWPLDPGAASEPSGPANPSSPTTDFGPNAAPTPNPPNTIPVPEPTTLALFATGASMTLALHLRRRARRA